MRRWSPPTRWRGAGRLGAATLLLITVLAGCRDGTSPGRGSLELQIRRSTVPAEEETIAVGATVQLSAVVQEATGRAVDPPPRPSWRSTAPEIASVDSAGVVTGRAEGSALVIAAVAAFADTVRINVANPVGSEISCTAEDSPVRLEVGQVYATSGERAVTLCVHAPTNAEYVLVPFNASSVAESVLSVDVTAIGARAVQGPPRPFRAPSSTSAAQPVEDRTYHEDFREHSARALEPMLRAASGLAPSPPRPARVPAVGELLRLNVRTDRILSPNGCTNPDYRTGRVMAVTQRAIVVADTANPRTARPQDTFSAEDYREFGEVFDTLIWRVDTENFGEPSDIDGNQRVILFFTRAVNELSETRSSSYVAGFFYNRDLFRRSGQSACAASNEAEMFYLMVPDPAGTATGAPGYGGNARSREFVRTGTAGVLAHEFQHLINDSRRLYVSKAPVWEETWLNEGLSHIAEELAFYAASGLEPRGNIGPSELSSARVKDAFYQYNVDNVERLSTFLQRPHDSSLLGEDDLPTRGAAWSFLRYAADRAPGDDSGLWRDLVNSSTQGLANLEQALGAKPREWMEDWAVSIYADDAVATEARYQQPSWNFRRVIPTILSPYGLPSYQTYPLATIPLTPTERRLNLRGGGAAYLRFGVGAGDTASIRTVVGGLPAPSRLRMALVRTK